jgi:hypothetical protein
MTRTVPAIALALLVGCATIPPGTVTDPTLAALAKPGPFRVAQYDVDWFDAKRQRHVPAHIYAPESPSGALPVIVFLHGLGNSSLGYHYLGEHWASYGYVSIHPEQIGAGRDAARRGFWHLFRAGFDRRNWTRIPGIFTSSSIKFKVTMHCRRRCAGTSTPRGLAFPDIRLVLTAHWPPAVSAFSCPMEQSSTSAIHA